MSQQMIHLFHVRASAMREDRRGGRKRRSGGDPPLNMFPQAASARPRPQTLSGHFVLILHRQGQALFFVWHVTSELIKKLTLLNQGVAAVWFLLIHHLTFQRDSDSNLISSQVSTEVRKSRFSCLKAHNGSTDF